MLPEKKTLKNLPHFRHRDLIGYGSIPLIILYSQSQGSKPSERILKPESDKVYKIRF